MTSKGSKFDGNKSRMDLIPSEILKSMGDVFGFGANKYGDHNWRKGIKHNRLYAATMRHLTAYWSGETYDPESGLNHLGHAAANIAMMMETPNYDNRFQNDKVQHTEDREDREQTLEINGSTAMASRTHPDSREAVLGPRDGSGAYISSDLYHCS